MRFRRHRCGCPVKTDCTGPEGDDVKKTSGHHQVLVEVDHIVWISGRQVHAKGGAQADEGQQSSGPTAVETRQQRQAAEQMD